MKKQVNLFLKLATLIYLFNSCAKENKPEETNSQNVFPTVSGYTVTDGTGNLIGPIDTTDWRFDDIWSVAINDLFGGAKNTNCNFEDSNMNVSAYPNPTTDIFNVSIGPIDFTTGEYVDTNTIVEVMIVNQDHEIISLKRQIFNSITFSLALADSNITDTIFRVYYKFTDKNNCVRCGHGDVLRN